MGYEQVTEQVAVFRPLGGVSQALSGRSEIHPGGAEGFVAKEAGKVAAWRRMATNPRGRMPGRLPTRAPKS